MPPRGNKPTVNGSLGGFRVGMKNLGIEQPPERYDVLLVKGYLTNVTTSLTRKCQDIADLKAG